MKLLVLTVALAAAAAGSDVTKKILRDITKFNNDAACWGIENRMQYALAQMKATEECSESDHHNLLKPANPFLALLQPVNNPFQTLPGNTNNFQTLPSRPNSPAGNTLNNLLRGSSSSPTNFGGQQATKPQFNVDNWNRMWSQVFSRQKRQASNGLLEPTEEDFQEFLEDFQDFKEDMATKLSNLTCVLSKLKQLDSNLQVNLAAFTGLWSQIDLSKTLAGQDPVWRNMMNTGYTDCYDLAKAWPQDTLNRNPVTKVFGRHMVFFKCAKKVEMKGCARAQANAWLTALYGDDPSFDWSQYGMPSNRYERAEIAMKVLYESASPAENFVGDFFNSEPHM